MEMEFERNSERYKFMKWGMQAFDTFKVVPPGIGIVHQVNLEYLARGVLQKDGVYYPDTLVGTDSHTTMINGIGVVGWGVGGIEAEAGMLGQPVYFLTPDVVGVHLKGKLREGVTATDLVLTVTEMLRKQKVVGKFVEFFGAGAAALTVPDRATIANMAPEYGATMGFFPVDDVTVDYHAQHRAHGRGSGCLPVLLQGAEPVRHSAGGQIDYSSVVELDLASIEPSLAGPKRPQDRVALSKMRETFNTLFSKPVTENGFNKPAAELDKRYATGLPERRAERVHADFRRRPAGSRQSAQRQRTGDGRRPPQSRGALRDHGGNADGCADRPWRCADRRNHLLHQHLQPKCAAGGGPAGEEGCGERPARCSRISRPRSRPARAW